jgi:beta-N-acetylhexosaminidase
MHLSGVFRPAQRRGVSGVSQQRLIRFAAVAAAALTVAVSCPAASAVPAVAASATLTTGLSVTVQHVAMGNVALMSTAAGRAAVAEAIATAPEQAVVAGLTARQLAGQRVIFSYSGLTPPASLLTLIRNGEAGGVLFFAPNYASKSQFASAVAKLNAANAASTNPARGYPLLLMTDQEGGYVKRLPGAPHQSEKQIGAIKPLSAAETAARTAGRGAASTLRGFGLNVNLAPVLDIYRTPGDFDDQFQRSYSQSKTVVSDLGAVFITAQQFHGVAATAKHFPGLGPASAKQNTDERPVTITTSAATLWTKDEYPYRAAIAAGVKLVMVSWAAYPSLGSTRPAGLSSAIVQGQLRTRLGFTGVTITDSIGAGALSHYGSVRNRALLAAKAGMQLILSTGSPSTGISVTGGLLSGYRDGKLSKATFQAAVTQILALRAGLAS